MKTKEEILEKYCSNNKNLCLAGKYTLTETAILNAMQEYADQNSSQPGPSVILPEQNSFGQWNYNMDEAPKDGTNILVVDPETNEVLQVLWDKEEIFYPGSKAKWTWCVPYSHQDEQGGCATVNNPIKWMPLPKP